LKQNSDNPYSEFIDNFRQTIAGARALPFGGFPPAQRAAIRPGGPIVLLFSPHPDDECITGGLALRLLREDGCRVVNIAVTLGSRKDRQPQRLGELAAACSFLGFETECAGKSGLENINPVSRANNPDKWKESVSIIAGILSKYKPAMIFLPHDDDFNSTHTGVHHLVADALRILPGSFSCLAVETEYWRAMSSPNLMVEISDAEAADLVAAISFHAGEVARNPYHVGLPSWLHDNVRRGSEIAGGQGGSAHNFGFAALYRLRKWTPKSMKDVVLKSCVLPAGKSAGSLLE